MWASTTEPRFVFYDYPHAGWRGEWIGDEEVRILDPEGRVTASRLRPREAFRGLRRQFRWDELDFLYFGGYATWNYLMTPFIFLHPGFNFELLPPIHGPQGEITRLRATFPPDVPTHSRTPLPFGDKPLGFPNLVALDIDEIRPMR